MAHFDLSKIGGVIPAMVSTFDEHEKLDLDRAQALTRYLCKKKIGGLYLTGSTGEGFMMTPEEREAFVEAVIEAAEGKVPVIVHVGAISTQATERLARHAEKAGADAVSSVPSVYWHFSDSAIEKYYGDIVQSCSLPMIVYNIVLSGLVSYEMLVKLGKIEGVGGVKYTASTHFDIMRIKEALGEKFKVFSGSDEMALSGLSFGADGLIGSTYNVIADRFIRLTDQLKAGDLAGARQSQKNANQLIFTMLKYDLYPTMKLLLREMEGVDAGYSRRPFRQFSKEEEKEILAEYRNVLSRLD